MRAYFFGNMYLSSIQQGIQAAHVVHELFLKYPGEGTFQTDKILWEWAENHKTMVLLNAGYSEEIRYLVDFFNHRDNPYPHASFNESNEALDGALTCVGVVLPEQIYYGAKQIREDGVDAESQIMHTGKVKWTFPEEREVEVSKWEFELMLHLNKYGLAK